MEQNTVPTGEDNNSQEKSYTKDPSDNDIEDSKPSEKSPTSTLHDMLQQVLHRTKLEMVPSGKDTVTRVMQVTKTMK